MGLIAPVLSVLALAKLPNKMTTVNDLLTPGHKDVGDQEVESILGIVGDAWPVKTARAMPYSDYLTTPYWKYVARRTKAKDGHICRACGANGNLVAHHIGYAHRGQEHRNMHLMTALCRRCHDLFHAVVDIKELNGELAPATATYGQGMAKSRVTSYTDDVVVVTKALAKQMTGWKEQWHWLKDHGINPKETGWRKRVVGKVMPRHLLGRKPVLTGQQAGPPG